MVIFHSHSLVITKGSPQPCMRPDQDTGQGLVQQDLATSFLDVLLHGFAQTFRLVPIDKGHL